MKKVITLIVVAVLMLGSLSSVSAASGQYVATNKGWVTIYKQPSTTQGSIMRLQLGQRAELVSKYNEYWYKVSFNGKTGYITRNSEYTRLVGTAVQTSSSTSSSSSSVADKRNKVVQTALSLQNKVDYVHWTDRQETRAPYKTDCSGFTYLVYRLAHIGVLLVNKDDDDQAKVGRRVAWGNFVKGDLIFSWTNSKDKTNVGHVGIYIGGGKMIHNAGSKNDVIISNVYSSYYKERFITARRVIN